MLSNVRNFWSNKANKVYGMLLEFIRDENQSNPTFKRLSGNNWSAFHEVGKEEAKIWYLQSIRFLYEESSHSYLIWWGENCMFISLGFAYSAHGYLSAVLNFRWNCIDLFAFMAITVFLWYSIFALLFHLIDSGDPRKMKNVLLVRSAWIRESYHGLLSNNIFTLWVLSLNPALCPYYPVIWYTTFWPFWASACWR